VRARRPLAAARAEPRRHRVDGSGKSTVLRTVLGLLAPVSGRVEVLGRAVDERDRRFRAGVAGVLDADAYFPGLTTREHLVLTARGFGVPEAGRVVDEVLEVFGIAHQSDTVPEALSSGQRRRLLLAAGFVRPRELLVLYATHDETLLRETGSPALLVGDDVSLLVAPGEAADLLAAGL
jgi:ABC-2 type transport system ATP-binding protein